MILLVDNYDSFTYNLYTLLTAEGAEVTVVRNDEPLPALTTYRGIVLSPGPSRPENAGNTPLYIKKYGGRIPIFGVCLGMQAIGMALGHNIRSAHTIQHGKTDRIRLNENSLLFKGITGPITGVRYHSLAVDADPGGTMVTATAESDGEIMAIEDTRQMLFGVQFHPESILSEQGRAVVRNFLAFCERTEQGSSDADAALLVRKLGEGGRLSFKESLDLFSAMMTGGLTHSQSAAALTAMHVRGECSEEIAGATAALNRHKVRFHTGEQMVVDTCGTGGDGKSCMNVSTAVSLTIAAMGLPVVKHGNRAMSGTFGSADILEALEIPIGLPKDRAEQQFMEHGYTFLFAPAYHPAVKQVVPIRKEMGFRTIFNLIGPLANPAEPSFQIIGLPGLELLSLMAEAAATLDRERIILYASEDGYDEVSTAASTRCVDVKRSEKPRTFTIDPADFFPPRQMPKVRNREEAELTFIRAINGSDPDLVNLIALNAALALVCCGHTPDLHGGFAAARTALQSGKVGIFVKQLTEDAPC